MGRLRSWIFQILWAGWTAAFALVIPVLWLSQSPPTAIRRITRVWARGVLALLAAVTGVRYIERGRELLPPKPYLIVANHQSTWETIAALVLFPDVAIVAKRELLKIPVMGWYLKHSPMVVIDRADAAKALREMAAACRAALSDGRSVLIFPEGTRRPPGSPVIFKRGVEFLYRTLGVPAVVVAHDSGRHWKPGAVLSPGVICATILPSITPGLNAVQFVRTAQTMMGAAVIAAQVQDDRLDAAAPPIGDPMMSALKVVTGRMIRRGRSRAAARESSPQQTGRRACDAQVEDKIDDALADSFPASDPPAFVQPGARIRPLDCPDA